MASEDITIRNCTAYDNHRQGLSVVSAVNLLVENCLFANTWGTAPEAGIDLEPDTEKQRLVNCVIRNCTFENNNGNEILVYLKQLATNSEPVSIRFDHCLARMTEARFKPPEPGPAAGLTGVAGIAVGEIKDDGPKGLIEFIDCVTEATGKEGARVYDKSATGARVRFVNCSFRNPWTSPAPSDGGPRVPIILHLRRPESTERLGGIDFQDCYVYDSAARPAVRFEEDKGDFGLRDVHGQILVTGPGTPSLKIGHEAARRGPEGPDGALLNCHSELVCMRIRSHNGHAPGAAGFEMRHDQAVADDLVGFLVRLGRIKGDKEATALEVGLFLRTDRDAGVVDPEVERGRDRLHAFLL